MKTRKIRLLKRKKRTIKRGGGINCFKTNKTGKIIKTWSCSAECGEDGACGPYS
jgi:hypothetical protein